MILFVAILLAAMLAAGPSHAGPLVAAIGAAATAVSGALAAGGIGAFALKLGGSLLLSAASSALMNRGGGTENTIQGRAVSVREPAAARRMIYGRARVGGTIIFMTTRTAPNSDRPNNELHMVVALAGHRIRSIGAVYLNGELAFDVAGNPTPRFAGNISLEKHLGAGTNAPFPYLRSISGGQWTDAHRLVGCPAIAIAFNFNPEIYPSGIPNVAVDVEGCDEVFDPRTGTTGYSENPALCLAHYMAHARYGLNASIGAVDGLATAELIAAANACDEVVLKVGGGTEPRYACNGVVDLAMDPKSIIEDLLTAMAGDAVYQAGQWRIYAGAWRAPTTTLTANDVMEGGLSLSTRISRAQNFNGVRGTFISPENDWAVDDFPAYASSVYLAEDKGERVWTDIVLPYTISASMAQRLAKIHLERQRRQFSVTVAGKLSTWRLATMDTVSLDYARWGFSGKPFEVRGLAVAIGDTIQPTLTLRETSPLIWDWSASEFQVYAAAPRTALPSPFDIAAPGSPSVTEELYVTRAGDGVKAKATVTWPASPSPYVAEYEVQARRNAAQWQLVGKISERAIEMEDIATGQWEWRVSALTRLGVRSPWVSVSKEIFGLGAPPAALQGVTLQSAGGLAILKWALPADLDVRLGGQVVIRHSAAVTPTWINSVSMDQVPGGTALAVVPLKPGAYVLRAVDSSGLQGPVTIVRAEGSQAVEFVSVASLVEEPVFGGAKTNVVFDGTYLILAAGDLVDDWPDWDAIPNFDFAGGIEPTGIYEFDAGMDFGTPARVRLRSYIETTVQSPGDLFDDRQALIDDWPSFDGADGGEVDVVVEYRATNDNPAGSPVWTGWTRCDSTEVFYRALQFRAVLTTTDPNYTPAISALRVYADEVA